ncbi:TPA: hypothetical protein UOJ16_000812 [Klebsiella pneumoniae]|uniref:Uncharacterized protein n=1 Tax=Klebsiella pneumoniae TaxID=573 RepID=A0A486T5X9_KLEPN|nr:MULTISPECIES: hypothetical protein [Klebsiella]HDT0764550.1 hypothetical protein [Klebsiella pneumoniae subsp. pneumoniae]KMA33581.1 hypothetical protein SL33_00543 [Klebsiella pneumoniae]MBG1794222.1 hypothetical protein [Klebsiella pneumoniae]MBG1808706.1 hypothetical protein [Klebsiella pneumoniae]MBG1835158.1 hypothetical protein [Klebsiella pneumoniae]
MNSANRNRTITIAEAVIAADKKDKTVYPASSLVEIWNAKYNMVPPNELPALKNQVELEVAAIRGAEVADYSIGLVPYGNFRLATVFGSHMPAEPDFNEN